MQSSMASSSNTDQWSPSSPSCPSPFLVSAFPCPLHIVAVTILSSSLVSRHKFACDDISEHDSVCRIDIWAPQLLQRLQAAFLVPLAPLAIANSVRPAPRSYFTHHSG
ncbi:hypothetical protein TYRP_018809 [Tyrophagus putrescentiae]|nr:hypothetical protein TYRP_018809 [Tyrophagus putrescentiae]